MKDIQEIMLQMDNLSKQIATTLNEDEKAADEEIAIQPVPREIIAEEESELEDDIKELASLITEVAGITAKCPTVAPTVGPTVGPTCPPASNRTVNFCCILNVPGNLGIIPQDFLRMIYNTKCLRCVVEPTTTTATVCGCPVNLTVYTVKIVGCIPFLINHSVNSTVCFSNPNFLMDLCCHDSVCVENIICTKCSQAEADAACAIIRRKLANCNFTTVTFNPVTNLTCNGVLKGLQVSGFFTLPSCNS
jgi:hypothetical protein